MSDADLRRDLVTANRIAHHEGLSEAFGHISARVPGSQDRFYIARRMSPALVTEDGILCMDVRGNVVEGSGRPNMEFWIHASIYAARPDVGVVVHAHPPYCVALAQWRAMAIGEPEFFTQTELDRTGPVAFDPVSFERAWDYYLARCATSASRWRRWSPPGPRSRERSAWLGRVLAPA